MSLVTRSLPLAGLILAATLTAQAQTQYPRVEVFGGYSYANLDGIGLLSPMRQNANGWAAGVSVNLYKHLGVTAEFAGQFGDLNNPFIICPPFPAPTECAPDVNFSANQFLFGPRFTARAKRFTSFGHVLFGVHRRRVDSFGFSGGPGVAPLLFPSVTDTDFALGFGGGLDINLGRRFALRALQADYIPVRVQGLFWADNVRLQTGVVVKLGSPEGPPAASRPQPQTSFPRLEIFGGYSYANVERFNIDGMFPRENLHGWGAGVGVNLNRYFGFTAGFAGQYGKTLARNGQACIEIFPPTRECFREVNLRTNQFLFGPRVTWRAKRVTGFGHVLLGANHINRFSPLRFGTNPATDFALAVGGGLDINLNRRLALRALQADYLPVRGRGVLWLDNLLLQSGIVIKLGGR